MTYSFTNQAAIADIVIDILDLMRRNAPDEFALLEKIGTFPSDWSMIRPENFIDVTKNPQWNPDSASFDLKDEASGMTICIGYEHDMWCNVIEDQCDAVWFQLKIGNHYIISDTFALNDTHNVLHQKQIDALVEQDSVRACLQDALKSIRTRAVSAYRAYERVLNNKAHYDTIISELEYLAPKRKKKS